MSTSKVVKVRVVAISDDIQNRKGTIYQRAKSQEIVVVKCCKTSAQKRALQNLFNEMNLIKQNDNEERQKMLRFAEGQ